MKDIEYKPTKRIPYWNFSQPIGIFVILLTFNKMFYIHYYNFATFDPSLRVRLTISLFPFGFVYECNQLAVAVASIF